MRPNEPSPSTQPARGSPEPSEPSIRDGSHYLRAFMSCTSSQLAVLDGRGTVLVANAAWSQFAGAKHTLAERPNEGENYLEMLESVRGDDRATAQELLRATREVMRGERKDFEGEITVDTADGTHVLLARALGFPGLGEPNFTVSFRDITPIRSAERRLKESEERFKFAVESTCGAVCEWNVPNGTMTCSGQLAKLLGFPCTERPISNPRAWEEHLHPDDVDATVHRFEELIEGAADKCVLEHRFRDENGSWHWVLTRCTVRERDASGRARRILGVHNDVTDLKEAEASLRDQRNQNRMLAKVAEHTTNSVIITDARGLIVWANRGFTKVTGYSLEEARGRKPGELLQGRDTDPAAVSAIRAHLQRREPVRERILNYRKNGEEFWLNLEIQPVFTAEGELEHLVAIMEDLTERERLEAERRLSQKLESVGQLAAGIAHEINTPIHFVGDSITYLEEAWCDIAPLLKSIAGGASRRSAEGASSGLSDDAAFHVENIPDAIARARDGVSRVASIVRAMKEFAHPDRGDFSSADINHAVRSAMVVSRNEFKYVGTVSAVLGEIPHVSCRIDSINQVLLNLLVNAAHALSDKGHTPESGRLEVRTRLEADFIVISMADNGTGIREENLERIFDPFFTTKEVGRGTGQGLAIARSIVVDLHGGRITVDSRLGEGSCFEVWLPAGRAMPTGGATSDAGASVDA